ncbi:MAG TPA: PH domain-containing protein [Streptosporangiaceae bacterium]|nr:PH domain-containing protein [Streptosporangiaceae bacterium]
MAADQGGSAAGRKPQVFRSVTAVIVWWVWLLFAVANLIDLAVQGRDHLSLVAASILLFVTGVAYVTAQRPRVLAGADTITVRNPIRDHVIPWPNVIRADLSDLLRVRVREAGGGDRAISAWAVHYSRRRQFVTETKARRADARGPRAARAASSLGGGYGFSGQSRSSSGGVSTRTSDPASAEAQAEHAIRYINDYAAGVPQDAPPGTVTSTWSWVAIAALIVPAVFILIVALL